MALSDETLNQEHLALRWGGFCGILGSLSLVVVFVFLAVLTGLETVAIEAEMKRFPDIRPIRIIENSMYLLAIALWTVHSAAMYFGLREKALAPALLGIVFMILGLCVLAVGAVPHTMTDPISSLYHADGATADQQAVLITAWTTMQGIVDMFVVTGLALTPLGMGLLGLGMLRSRTYGRRYGWIGLFLAAAGLVAGVLCLIGPTDIAAIGMFAVIFFHAIIGWGAFRARLPGA